MKSGMAISENLVAPSKRTNARLGITAGPEVATIATSATMPSAIAIGMLMSTSAMRARNIINRVKGRFPISLPERSIQRQ